MQLESPDLLLLTNTHALVALWRAGHTVTNSFRHAASIKVSAHLYREDVLEGCLEVLIQVYIRGGVHQVAIHIDTHIVPEAGTGFQQLEGSEHVSCRQAIATGTCISDVCLYVRFFCNLAAELQHHTSSIAYLERAAAAFMEAGRGRWPVMLTEAVVAPVGCPACWYCCCWWLARGP